jgi:hypothetical protein
MDAPRPLLNVTQSVTGCIPTQSVGMITLHYSDRAMISFMISLVPA